MYEQMKGLILEEYGSRTEEEGTEADSEAVDDKEEQKEPRPAKTPEEEEFDRDEIGGDREDDEELK